MRSRARSLRGARLGRRSRLLLTVAFILVLLTPAGAHEVGGHGDPELLNHWRTQLHLLFQWAHLVAFGLWLGGMLAATRLSRLPLEPLLFGTWGLFLVSVATGGYNMEFGAATPDAPNVLVLAILERRWEFGTAYIILVGVKQAMLLLAALWTAAVTVGHLHRPPERDRGGLRATFVAGSLVLGLALAGVTSMVLVLHEAVDVAPTPLHSLGGVVGPLGAPEFEAARQARSAAPPPYGTDTRDTTAGFRLFTISRVAGDTLGRFGHLFGFAAWLGGVAASLLVPASEVRRVVPLLWLGLAVQLATGAYQMHFWTPFALIPYPWRLSSMAEFRFGYTYTLLLALKLGLAGMGALGTAGLAMAAREGRGGRRRSGWIRALGWLNLAVGLGLAYVAVALLLVHEGVDHAL